MDGTHHGLRIRRDRDDVRLVGRRGQPEREPQHVGLLTGRRDLPSLRRAALTLAANLKPEQRFDAMSDPVVMRLNNSRRSGFVGELDETLVDGVWNIPVPEKRDIVVPAIVLAPLVGFDRACYRLGYGGGYFDRTLASLSPRPLAIGVGKLLAAQLYGVPFWDPVALAVAAGSLMLCALVAALIPASRAAFIPPMSALRSE